MQIEAAHHLYHTTTMLISSPYSSSGKRITVWYDQVYDQFIKLLYLCVNVVCPTSVNPIQILSIYILSEIVSDLIQVQTF